jgi:hypothetical protein
VGDNPIQIGLVDDGHIGGPNFRPTPFELSSDPWVEGGSLFTLCDLHLDADEYVINQEDSIAASLLAKMRVFGVKNTAGVPGRIQK